MCGIFASPDIALTRRALDLMRHRGPDESRLVHHGALCIGFNRLRIVDSDAPEAQQPYISARARVVVFNGEIYNYRALDPTTPSEVALLARMLDEGLDLRQHLDGEYAIASYEPSCDRLTLYRDRFGSCPLYYQTTPYLAISSERRRLLNPREVPAHGRVVLRGGARPRVLSSHRMLHYGATSMCGISLRGIADALLDAVYSRAMHTDSGFSVAYSGGIDSSLVLYALRDLRLCPRALLTAYFSLDSEDLLFARRVADLLSLPLQTFKVGNEDPREISRIAQHFDSPRAPTAMRWRGGLRTWSVAKHSPTRVILCGDGADELLGGYPQHFAMPDPLPYRVNKRCLTSIRSMPVMNLDRTNKLGMAHSKEFRSPFLASTLSYLLLSGSHRAPGKPLLRELLEYFGAPPSLVNRGKYSADELAYASLPAGVA
jgi:asparagine synthase (glutamine-hydrolysing)